jgi:hypothetical protein
LEEDTLKTLDKAIVLGIIVLVTACLPACSLQVSMTGGDGSGSQTVNMNFEALKDTVVQGFATVDGANVKPNIKTQGRMKSFEQTHQVTDSTGKHAEVYAKVINGKDISYTSKVSPKEGTSRKEFAWVLAEEWLSVGSADYIKASAMASLGPVSSGARTEVTSGSLSGYHNRAFTDGYSVQASQFGPEGEDPVYQASGENIVISSYGRDNEGLYRLTTTMTQDGTTPAQFIGRTEGHFGEAVQYINCASGDEVTVEDLRFKPGDSQEVTLHHRGSLDGIITSRASGRIINDMQKFADAGDSLSVGAGFYKEKVVLDKDLSIAGEGEKLTVIDGSYVDGTKWDQGSTFTIKPGVNAHISDMTIQGGYGDYYQLFGDNYIYYCGGGIFNQGTLMIDDCMIAGNKADFGGGIYNGGMVTVRDSSISGNTAKRDYDRGGVGGGIYNDYQGLVNLISGSIDHNTAAGYLGGGIYNAGTIEGNTWLVYNNSPDNIYPISNSSPVWPGI